MAGHLVVEKTKFRLELLDKAISSLNREMVKDDYVKVDVDSFPNYKAMKLPVSEYNMDEEHGKVDAQVISLTRMEDGLEYHLDDNGKINEIYLVM